MTVGQDTPQGSLNEWAVDKWSKVSKAVFDARDNVDIMKTASTVKSFGAGVVDIMQDAGIPEKYLTGLGGENVGSDEWMVAFKDMAETGADLFMDTAITGLFTAVGRPDLAPSVMGVAHNVVGTIRELKADAAANKVDLLQEGTWVYINTGPPPGPEIGYKDEMRRRLFGWQDAGPPPDRIAIGFYVGPAAAPGYLQCFNFGLMHEGSYHVDEVAACGPKKIVELNNNKILRGVRDLKIYEPIAPPKMVNLYGVPTDPGTEVVYEDERYWIAESEGDRAVIEDVHGQRKEVSIDVLEKGRVTHTNAWNYRKGEIFETGFEADCAAKVYSGQWVWITARDNLVQQGVTNFELACVWNIQRDGAYVFNAIDGDLVIVDDVWPVSANLADILNVEQSFANFRNAAVEGENTNALLLGRDHLLVCIGQTHDAQVDFPKPDTPGQTLVHRKAVEMEDAGDEEARWGTGDTPGEEVLGHPGEVEYGDFEPAITSRAGGDSNFIYIALAAGAAFLLYSVD